MEYLKNNKQFNVLKWIFIAISAFHIIYAVITMRGMYLDGGFFMTLLLNNLSNNIHSFIYDVNHTRTMITILQELPVIITDLIFRFENKYIYMAIFTLSTIGLPYLFLWWNYKLSKRTNRIDIFFWSLFCYCSILITFSIWSVVETIIGATLHFILWNYLILKEEYKKRDILAVIFLIAVMFATYEYVAVLGIIFFIASLYYTSIDSNEKSRYIKSLIGLGALGASTYNILIMLSVNGEANEIRRFIQEAFNFVPSIWEMCSIFSIITIILLLFLIARKTKLSNIFIGIFSIIYLCSFIRMTAEPHIHIVPVWEGHFRCFPCIFIPVLFIILPIFDALKKKINEIKFTNFICIVLMCGITQTCWQIVNTYYWDKNIQYMKNELATTNELLYIPSNFPPLSDFLHPEIRRFIWHSSYTFTSILFSPAYEQKTILMHYDTEINSGNKTYRDELYIPKNTTNIIHIPFAAGINIKNKFWDLTKCAEAIDKYNKEHNIETFPDKMHVKP